MGIVKKIASEDYVANYAQPKGNYLTEHQDLSAYAKKTEIPTDYAKENHEHGQYLTQHQDLSSYAKKTELPTKISQLTNDSNFLSAVPSEYITETELKSKGYLTEHQDLSAYAKTSDLANFGGTVEITSGNPQKSNTVITIDPSAEEINIYSAEEVDQKIQQISTDVANKQPKGDYATSEQLRQLSEEKADEVTLKAHVENTLIHVTNVEKQIWNGKANIGDIPTKTSQLSNDSKYVTENMLDTEIEDLKKQGIQQTPLFANSVEELKANGDTSKIYVLPDGYIYAYILTEVEGEPSYTNMIPLSVNKDGTQYVGDNGEDGYRKNVRYSASSAVEKTASGYDCIGFFRVKAGDTIRIKNVSEMTKATDGSAYNTAYYFTETWQQQGGATNLSIGNDSSNQSGVELTYENGVYTFNVTNHEYIHWCKLTLQGVTDSTIITVNEEITEGGNTTIDYAWANTGHTFIPADYEGRVIDLEGEVTEHTKKIKALEKAVETGGVDENENSAYTRIKEWRYPIHEDAPVFLLEENKPAIATNEQTTEAVYAKYDSLMAQYSHYITREECEEKASDGTTPLYAYHFKEAEPHHYSTPIWSETKPVLLVCSGVHPTEQSGVHSLYYAMEEITKNPKLLDLRRNVHFVIVPMINPTGFTDSTYGVRNPDGIQVHYNFEVDFKYPTDAGYVTNGNRNHGGETPLSIPETRYFNTLMERYKDTLACVISCHNNDVDVYRGTDFVWCSCATHYMCNLGFRFVDKMSSAWREKYGTAFDEGVVWANEYVLSRASEGSTLFNETYAQVRPEWDYRVGMASLSTSGGTEYKQALKYGVHGINVEVCDRCMVLDKDFNKKRTSNVTTMGAETYINFFRTFMAVYDPKDKKDYAPNLPWEE